MAATAAEWLTEHESTIWYVHVQISQHSPGMITTLPLEASAALAASAAPDDNR
jgi:hypothetical protein